MWTNQFVTNYAGPNIEFVRGSIDWHLITSQQFGRHWTIEYECAFIGPQKSIFEVGVGLILLQEKMAKRQTASVSVVQTHYLDLGWTIFLWRLIFSEKCMFVNILFKSQLEKENFDSNDPYLLLMYHRMPWLLPSSFLLFISNAI